jgi:hypothetical protein
MESCENIFIRKELHDLYSSGEVSPLGDLYSLEDLALTVKELNEKIEFYKAYKKKKIEDISNEIKSAENEIDFLKKVAISTLKHNKEKKVNFPGSCSVSSRRQSANWVIDDDEEFSSVIKKAGEKGEKIDGVLKIKETVSVVKKEANKILNMWEKSGKLNEFIDEQIAHKEPEGVSVSMSYVKEDVDQDEAEEIDIPVAKSDNKSEIEEYDGI